MSCDSKIFVVKFKALIKCEGCAVMADSHERKQRDFLDSLYNEMKWKMLYYARRHLNDPQQAEDAVQNALVVACRRVEMVMQHEKPHAWLMEVLRRTVLDMRESIAVDYQRNSADLDNYQNIHYDDYHLIEYGDFLDLEDFKVIEMAIVQRYSIREIAEDLGISEEAAKKRKQRSLDRLRQKYFNEKETS